MKHFFGEFNQNGYSIYERDMPNIDAIYQAGNCKYDSTQNLPVGSEGTIDIITIKEHCDYTGKGWAEEHNGIWDGCGQIDDYNF